jgi:hypothetical protein
MKYGREIHCEAHLATHPWAGFILTSQQCEGENQVCTDCIHTPNQTLQLSSAQPIVVRNATVYLTPRVNRGLKSCSRESPPV